MVGLSERLEAFLSSCEKKSSELENGVTAEIERLTGSLTRAAWELGGRTFRDWVIFVVGIVLGLLVGAYAWRTSQTAPEPKPSAEVGAGVERPGQRPSSKR